MKIKKTKKVCFRTSQALFKKLKEVKNLSEFMREAAESKLKEAEICKN